MRKSASRTGSRPFRAGVAVVATAAAVVAGTAAPAYAVAGTIDPDVGPIGGGSTTIMTSVGAFTSITAASGRFVANSGTCPTTFGTTSSTNLAAAVLVNDADTATMTVPSLAAGTYRACIYGVTTGSVASTTPLSVNSTDTLVLNGANTAPTLTPTVGPITAGATITATGLGPYLATATTPAATFKLTSVGACNTTYTTTSATAATTVTKNVGNTVATITAPALTAGAYNLCIYAGTSTSSVLLGTTTYTAMAAPVLSPKAGNSGGGNTITVTTPSAVISGGSPAVTFTKGNCPAAYAGVTGDHVPAVTVTKISTSKVAVLIPVGVVVDVGASTTAWNTCLFSSTAGNLIAAPVAYTVAPALGAANPTILPSGGPAQGGTSIVITGLSGIPTADGATLSASLGGSPLEGITVVDNTSISARTTAHAAGDVKLSVTTAAGTQTSTLTEFTYSYGITISPNAAPNTADVTMDIMGAGFNNILSWGTEITGAAPTTGAYVFLVSNAWFTTADGGSGLNAGLATQCKVPTVISDNELICTLALTDSLTAAGAYDATPVTDGAYSIVVVNDISDTSLDKATQYSRVSSGAAFTVSEY